jgi:hypothetical protein
MHFTTILVIQNQKTLSFCYSNCYSIKNFDLVYSRVGAGAGARAGAVPVSAA